MKKNDWILAGTVIAAALIIMGIYCFFIQEEGAKVTVTVDGAIYGTYDLEEEQQIHINGTNTLEIRDGKADMIDASCPDKLCVHQKAISKEGETIVCLPNKIVAEVSGTQESTLDAIAN